MEPWERIDQAVQDVFFCGHGDVHVRYQIHRDGRRAWVRQCVRCGANLGAVKKTSEDVTTLTHAEPFDEQTRAQWCADRAAYRTELWTRHRQQERQQWFGQHSAYLNSPEWRRLRARVLERDGGLCQGCRQRPATQVHHLTYKRWQREMLFDLVAVCDHCHEGIHREGEVA